MKKALKELKALTLNKKLEIDEEAKKIITTAEKNRYTYWDYTKEKIEQIASKNLNDLKITDAFVLVQALFPKYLVCSGLFDCFLMFEIKNNKRFDPPKYYYANLTSYLNNNNELKFNYLASEIIDLFKVNNIDYNKQWDKILEGVNTDDRTKKNN